MTTRTFADFAAKYESLFSEIYEILREGEQKWKLTPQNACFQKNRLKAAELLDLGLRADSEGKTIEAFNLYCKSIARGVTLSDTLADAFSKRSDVLFRLRQFEFSLLDVNRALQFSRRLTPESRTELLKRKKILLRKIRKNNSYKNYIGGEWEELFCTVYKDEPPLPSGILEERFFHIYPISEDATDLDWDYSLTDDEIWRTKFSNPFLPNVSSKVQLECDEEWGRHWVAVEDIAPGEVLAIEDIFALRTSSHDDNRWFNHCAYCTVWCEALIPCPYCSSEMYCSKLCSAKANRLYHRFECPVLVWLTADENHEDVLFALRILLVGTKGGSKLKDLMNNPKVYESLEGKRNCVGVPYWNQYRSIMNLFWKVDYNQSLSSVMRDKKVSSIVGKIMNQLRTLDFFGHMFTLKEGHFIEAEQFATMLLFHHLSILPKYRIGLSAEYIGGDLENYPGRVQKVLGYAIGPIHGLMNHSCDANAVVLGNRRRLLTYSLKPIQKGEQIFRAYYEYSECSRSDRRDLLLKNYEINCPCRACMGNWPTFNVSNIEQPKFITSSELLIADVKEGLEMLLAREGEKKPTLCEFNQQRLSRFLKFNETIRECVEVPSSVIILCENFIKACMIKKGNCYSLYTAKQLMNHFPDKVVDEILAHFSRL